MKKYLWLICLCLALGSFTLVFVSLDHKNDKQIAGAEDAQILGDLQQTLKLPPEKSENFKAPLINAKSALLIDRASAYPLYEKNSATKVPIASTTKVMTALVVLENYPERLDETVTITYPMIAVEGSDIQLRTGEKIKVNDLLKGLLIMSGNDAAYSLALNFGSKEAFVREMNDKAQYYGMSSTHYRCPAGLDDEGYSTAHDLAILTDHALNNQTFKSIVSTPQTVITSTDGSISHELKNSNRLMQIDNMYYYPFAVGVKTGFTYAAGHCLVSSAIKNNHQLIGVILNTNENTITASAKESRKLLDWGFNNWQWQ